MSWYGVDYGWRTFLPMLIAADEARIVNTASALALWARGGARGASTAYSTAKFAIRGFSEALITDLRLHAPHVGVSVVMPGHVGTDVLLHSASVLGKEGSAGLTKYSSLYRSKAPLDAVEAARIILDGVQEGRWRILVGDDAVRLDQLVRDQPEEAYEDSFIERMRQLDVLSFAL